MPFFAPLPSAAHLDHEALAGGRHVLHRQRDALGAAERPHPSHREDRAIAEASEVLAEERHHRLHVVVAQGRLLLGRRAVATTDPPHHVGDHGRTTDPCAASVTMLVRDAGERARDRRRALPFTR